MRRLFIFLVFLIGLFCLTSFSSFAQNGSDRYRELENQIKEYESKLSETQSRGRTLTSEIAYMDNQIRRTTLQISLTEKKIADLTDEIATLSGKIDRLEASLTKLSDVLLSRIIATYKNNTTQPLEIFFGSEDFGHFLLRLKYIRSAQASDKLLLYEVQQTKDVFTQQKLARETKKKEQETLEKQLKSEKSQLDSQKAVKGNLLAITKNDERKYQDLLASVRAELEAIQAITAGKGEETEAGTVNEGARIASVIQGSSCNSSGTHLHFIVGKDGTTYSPFSYLKSGIEVDNCSGSSCGSGDGDPFNPGGNWNWPINSPVKYWQGYGATWATRNTWVGRVYNFHNGIDINNEGSNEVKAVKAGTLFRGSYAGSSGCRLRYVRVHHSDGGLDTFYLHINY